jgi:hypothetical protein
MVRANIDPRQHVEPGMKKMCAILAVALLSPLALDSAMAAGPLQEGPLHWTVRHVRNAAVWTGNTLSKATRKTEKVVHRGTRRVRRALR